MCHDSLTPFSSRNRNAPEMKCLLFGFPSEGCASGATQCEWPASDLRTIWKLGECRSGKRRAHAENPFFGRWYGRPSDGWL